MKYSHKVVQGIENKRPSYTQIDPQPTNASLI